MGLAVGGCGCFCIVGRENERERVEEPQLSNFEGYGETFQGVCCRLCC